MEIHHNRGGFGEDEGSPQPRRPSICRFDRLPQHLCSARIHHGTLEFQLRRGLGRKASVSNITRVLLESPSHHDHDDTRSYTNTAFFPDQMQGQVNSTEMGYDRPSKAARKR
ncbi:hypothetical protein I7I51_06324 [Histoplasma capsulatum]|uniref:Uncharacterized protein n=1 Tax=Ajellomyces capsulatus TaxID=5037 RepID=A0A8A1MK36_AJECA|nr:hypothetical protein I7I51_06324 [Histoplasma capsulatum]